jgi:chaperonin GroES
MNRQLHVINDQLIVQPLRPGLPQGELFIPENDSQRLREGIVIAVGSGQLLRNGRRVPMQVQPDDHVFYVPASGTELQIDDQLYLVLKEDTVRAILRNQIEPMDGNSISRDN